MAEKTKKTTEDKKVETNIEETTEEKVTTKPRKRVQVSRDLEVAFINFTSGGFIYIDPKTQNRYEMESYGDMDYITVGELLTMKNSNKSILDKFWILLVDVLSDDVELEDVLKYLQLDKKYEDFLTPDEVDNLILKSNTGKFENIINKSDKNLSERIVERAILLFREGKFNDYSKMEVIKKVSGNEELFTIIEKD